MRAAATVICTLVSVAATAVELDGVSMGQPCSEVLERERSAGLHDAYGPQSADMEVLVFAYSALPSVTHQIIVRCTGNGRSVSMISLNFMAEDRAAAEHEFAIQKDSLSRQFGTPVGEEDRIAPEKKQAFAEGKAKYFQHEETLWFPVAEKAKATLTLALVNGLTRWQVNAQVTPDDTAAPNNRIERPREP